MGLFENFPWTNFQQKNLDWIVRTCKDLLTRVGVLEAGGTEGVVKYNETQTLNEGEKSVARENIGAMGTTAAYGSFVQYNAPQTLTNDQKENARGNVGAVSESEVNGAIVSYVNGSPILYYSSQTLESNEQAQARQNIGAASFEEAEAAVQLVGDARFVRYDGTQLMTEEQQAQARANIGVSAEGVTGAVLYDQAQSLTEAQKQQARDNIGAGTGSGSADNAVLYVAQTLTEQQQYRARLNIGSASLENAENVAATAVNENAVKYSIGQSLTTDQQQTARENIGAMGSAEILPLVGEQYVSFAEPQTLTETQKAQARANIGAGTGGGGEGGGAVEVELTRTGIQYGWIKAWVSGTMMTISGAFSVPTGNTSFTVTPTGYKFTQPFIFCSEDTGKKLQGEWRVNSAGDTTINVSLIEAGRESFVGFVCPVEPV